MAIDRKILLDAALAGYDTPVAAVKYLFPEVEGMTADPDILAEITRIFNTVDFNTDLQLGKEDIVGAAVASIRRTVLDNVLEVKELAKSATDPRVRLAANKDLLDRAGLAPAQKTVAYSPSDYVKLVQGLAPKDNDENKDQPAGVVPEATIRPETGAGGS